MRTKRKVYKTHKDLPKEEFLSGGSPLCAGCGGLTTLRLIHKALGENVVIVNAAGCMTLMAVFPFTPLRSSWLYTTMGSASAGAQGVRDALDVLKAKGELAGRRRSQGGCASGRWLHGRYRAFVDLWSDLSRTRFLVSLL